MPFILWPAVSSGLLLRMALPSYLTSEARNLLRKALAFLALALCCMSRLARSCKAALAYSLRVVKFAQRPLMVVAAMPLSWQKCSVALPRRMLYDCRSMLDQPSTCNAAAKSLSWLPLKQGRCALQALCLRTTWKPRQQALGPQAFLFASSCHALCSYCCLAG